MITTVPSTQGQADTYLYCGSVVTDRQTDRQTNRQTNRQTDRQIDRQAGRQAGSQSCHGHRRRKLKGHVMVSSWKFQNKQIIMLQKSATFHGKVTVSQVPCAWFGDSCVSDFQYGDHSLPDLGRYGILPATTLPLNENGHSCAKSAKPAKPAQIWNLTKKCDYFSKGIQRVLMGFWQKLNFLRGFDGFSTKHWGFLMNLDWVLVGYRPKISRKNQKIVVSPATLKNLPCDH